MFQTKDFVSIVASCVNRMRTVQTTITDFNIGAVARTLVECVAQEVDQLYQEILIGLMESIPTAVYDGFDFPAAPALAAAGSLSLVISPSVSAILVAAGTAVAPATSSVSFVTTADVLIPAGTTTALIPVAAGIVGSAGNIPAGQSWSLSPSPAGFASATNLAPIAGQDAETPAARKLRFQAFVASLPRGTVASLTYAVSTAQIVDAFGNVVERAALSSLVEPWVANPLNQVNLVNIYVHNGVGATSSALVTLASDIVHGYTDAAGVVHIGWKAAGVVVTVSAATDVPVNITATATLAPGAVAATVAAGVQAALASYIAGIPIVGAFVAGAPTAATFLHAEAESLALAVPGVADIVITAPSANVAGSLSAKFVPGTITVGTM